MEDNNYRMTRAELIWQISQRLIDANGRASNNMENIIKATAEADTAKEILDKVFQNLELI